MIFSHILLKLVYERYIQFLKKSIAIYKRMERNMDKKTIGQFIAILRKANGMTQKQLAEKLNVTDKTVSRWERDESAPDLMLIPVIADIFQITSDELLRGERKKVENVAVSPIEKEKTERSIEYILDREDMKLTYQSIIAIGVTTLGLIAAIVCNFVLARASIGFFIACGCYLLAIVCETIFCFKARLAISGENYFYKSKLSSYKWKIISKLEISLTIIITFFVCTIPLIECTNLVLDSTEWIGYGAEYGFVCVVICLISICVFNEFASGAIFTSKEDIVKTKRVNHFRLKYIFLTIGLEMICTIGMNVTNYLPTTTFATGDTFYNIDDFIEYMETPYSETGEELSRYIATGYYESICGKGYEVNNLYVREISPIEYKEDGSFYSVTTYNYGQIKDAYMVIDSIATFGKIICVVIFIIIIWRYKKGIKNIYDMSILSMRN